MTADDGFLSRWGRRKADARSGAPPAEPTPALESLVPAPSSPPGGENDRVAPVPAQGRPEAAAAEPPPLPTLEDVARLTRDSDFSPYVARNVDASVRNAAMKKLFSDPHFNVMDGLDTYIDDYGKPDPIPLSMLRRMNQAAVLGLFADEVEPTDAPSALPAPPAKTCPDGAAPSAVAQSTPPAHPPDVPESPDDDDPDMRLQPDDADRRAGAGPGPRL